MLTDSEIKQIVENAFLPFQCVAEIWDYKKKLKFKVFDSNGNGVIEAPSLILRDIRDKNSLQTCIESYRDCIKQNGLKLNPWSIST